SALRYPFAPVLLLKSIGRCAHDFEIDRALVGRDIEGTLVMLEIVPNRFYAWCDELWDIFELIDMHEPYFRCVEICGIYKNVLFICAFINTHEELWIFLYKYFDIIRSI